MLAGDEDRRESSGGLGRRDLMKAAVSIGGASAFGTAMSAVGLTGTAAAGRLSAADRDNRQHAWAEYLATDGRGLAAPPAHHVLLFMRYDDYRGHVVPKDRKRMEKSFRQLERALEWSNEGLLFTVNYSIDYFDRYFDRSLSGGVDLRPAQDTIDATRARVDPDDIVAEDYDLFIDLASDNGTNVLAAEQALFGEIDELNGVDIDYDLRPVVESRPTSFPDRRTGFVTGGEPKEHIGSDDLGGEHDLSLTSGSDDQGDGSGDAVAENIHEDAPLSMGFQSVHADNIPSEDLVTMVHDQTLGGLFEGPGQFAQGTIQHASKLRIDLSGWYADNDLEGRTARMFSPHHDAPDDVVNNNLRSDGPADARIRDVSADDDLARRTEDDAKSGRALGHGQKLARARFDLTRRDTDDQENDELDTTILRRDFNTTDAVDAEEESALHFLAIMRFNGYMNYVRQAMNGVNFDNETQIANSNLSDVKHTDLQNADVAVEDDGFLNYVTTHRRGNFVMPPITVRSLPGPQALQASVGTADKTYENGEDIWISVDDVDAGDVEVHTARFGPIVDVNQADGAKPIDFAYYDIDDDGKYELLLEFIVDGFDSGQQTAKFRARTDHREEVQGTATIDVA